MQFKWLRQSSFFLSSAISILVVSQCVCLMYISKVLSELNNIGQLQNWPNRAYNYDITIINIPRSSTNNIVIIEFE